MTPIHTPNDYLPVRRHNGTGDIWPDQGLAKDVMDVRVLNHLHSLNEEDQRFLDDLDHEFIARLTWMNPENLPSYMGAHRS